MPPDSSLLQYQDILRIDVPSAEHVTLLQAWMEKEKPLDDGGKDYLADIEPRGVWERQRLKFAREPRELASLDMKYDSILARIVRKTPLGQFYLEDIVQFGPPDDRGTLWFFPSSKVDTLVSIVAVILAAGLTVISMMALYLETRDPVRIGLAALFSFVAAMFLAICGAKKSEIIIGTIG
ncbi:hypothetical protein NEMBOFW57_001055 [Staphylotrichum longicolle]|uniref:DUF6594 domain-containing protein n=1 Tax=Staphylotrichum longicolle TaxID=669026 RepID=A0AAD4I285_9PEZI|nr:hypothetical protein NEMBOFW57_001055 [Staphylotrichum longicolle]